MAGVWLVPTGIEQVRCEIELVRKSRRIRQLTSTVIKRPDRSIRRCVKSCYVSCVPNWDCVISLIKSCTYSQELCPKRLPTSSTVIGSRVIGTDMIKVTPPSTSRREFREHHGKIACALRVARLAGHEGPPRLAQIGFGGFIRPWGL